MSEKLISLLLFLSLSLLCLEVSANNNSNKIWDTTPNGDNILFVNASVVGGDGSGNSWANAMPSLAEALRWARTAYNTSNTIFDTTPLKIYVAKGTYLPAYHAADASYNSASTRLSSFVLVKNVQLYGGFDPVNGIDDLTKTRIYGNSGTILSGNIGNVTIDDDNVYHVVIATGPLGSALLNGITVKGGYTTQGGAAVTVNGEAVIRTSGAGIYIQKSSPVLTNVIVSNNFAHQYGAGIYNNDSASPTLTSLTIINNYAYSYGGGIYNYNRSSPVITNTTISDNRGYYVGGGIYNSYLSSPVITNTIISGNTSSGGGGVYNHYFSTPLLNNVLISGNISTNHGGGMTNEQSSPVLTNVTISGNSATINGGGMFNQNDANPQIRNTIIFGNNSGIFNYGATQNSAVSTPVISYSLVQGLTVTTNGNIDGAIDPKFVAPQVPGLSTAGNYRLQYTSPAINAGNNSLFQGLSSNTKDFSGNPRVYDYVNGGIIDIGAYEYQWTAQTIAFATLDPKTTNSADFVLTGTATSGLAVSYTSSNTAVAEVYEDNGIWKVKIKAVGTTDITAKQAGDANYGVASDVVRTLTVTEPPLPVNLISYKASVEENAAKLEWKTASEQNNKNFVVYRSGEDKAFIKLGEVNGQGTTSLTNSYTFYDRQPLKGNNYYRLVQVDLNGKPTELGERVLNFELAVSVVQLYPNPTKKGAMLSFAAGKYTRLTVSSVEGKALSIISLKPQEYETQIDLAQYPVGVYFVKLIGATESITKKIIKQ